MISVGLRKDLNSALRLIAEKLDLDETRYKNAIEKYHAVADWLQAKESNLSQYSPDIYPQGSFALGTIVKPLTSDEYDIDLVCVLNGYTNTPNNIKIVVGERLKQNAVYKNKLEELNRCWRLKYKKEFHMDILPAKPLNSEKMSPTAIEIPDRKLAEWKQSDPKGYVEWFKKRMEEQYSLNMRILAEKSIDPVPEYKVKTTLQQAIQLMKRNRDIEFENDCDDKPISIIISTLAGHAYLNQSDLFETILALTESMPNNIRIQNDEYWVMNPVNHEENFADKWVEQPQRRIKFLDWIQSLNTKLKNLHNCKTISDTQEILQNLFGEKITQDVLHEMAIQKQINNPTSVKTPPTVKINNNKPWKN